MDHATLIAKALELRESWVDLEPGKRVRVRRPPEAEMLAFQRGANPEQFLRTAVGWDGFTEADILGAAVGSSSEIKFNEELWVVLALDKLEWVGKVVTATAETIKAHFEQQEAAAKN